MSVRVLLSSPRPSGTLALPDCAVAAAAAAAVVLVAGGQLFVGAGGGGPSSGLRRGAPAGVEGGAGTGPAQGRLQGAGRSEACWEEGPTCACYSLKKLAVCPK